MASLDARLRAPHIAPKRYPLVFAWGWNKLGQLGVSSSGSNRMAPEQVIRFGEVFTGLDHAQVACGYAHTLFLTFDGVVHGCGWNHDGQLGLGKSDVERVPQPLTALKGKRIVQIVAAGNSSYCLSSEGEVFSFGAGTDGQLGHDIMAGETRPRLVQFALWGKSVQQVAAGGRHALAVTEEGALFAWGSNADSRLAHILQEPCLKPREVTPLAQVPVVQAAAGLRHSLALTREGRVFAWGCNDDGRLGLPTDSAPTEPFRATPVLLDSLLFTRIVQVACGARHCLALTERGETIAWGYNGDGETGVGAGAVVPQPRFLPALEGKKVSRIGCGARHSFAITDDGTLYTWGCNRDGQLGHDSDINSSTPTAVRALSGYQVIWAAAGYAHTAAVCVPRD